MLSVTDRVAFVITEMTDAAGQTWKATDDEVRARVKDVAPLAPLR